MIEAGLWGLGAGSGLLVGAVLGALLPVSRRYVAWVMAFGAGALISALAFDLASEAFARGGTTYTAAGLAAGALTFFIGDTAIERIGRRGEPPQEGPIAQTGGPAIVLGVLLDSIPEAIVLGASLLIGGGPSTSFFAAVWVSNVPEAMAGGRDLSDEGHSRRWILGLWAAMALAAGIAAALSNLLLAGLGNDPLAFAQAFAGGAILAMLADTMFPEAYQSGGKVSGLATVLGFAAAFFLSRAS